MSQLTKKQLNPLYVIFENQLMNFQDETIDRTTFIQKVVDEYIHFLAQKQIALHPQYKEYILDELTSQVNTMLIKKIYGCLSIEEFQMRDASKEKKKRSKRNYRKLSQKSRKASTR